MIGCSNGRPAIAFGVIHVFFLLQQKSLKKNYETKVLKKNSMKKKSKKKIEKIF
jgi:hypothetical protein